MHYGPNDEEITRTGPGIEGMAQPVAARRRRRAPVAIAVAGGLAVLAVGLLIGSAAAGGATAAAPGATVTITETVTAFANTTDDGTGAEPAAPEPVAGTIPEGTHRVPQDVKPGTYRTSGGDGCYWARLSSLDGDSIIANNLGNGPMTVTIKRSDKGFETANCADWKRV